MYLFQPAAGEGGRQHAAYPLPLAVLGDGDGIVQGPIQMEVLEHRTCTTVLGRTRGACVWVCVWVCMGVCVWVCVCVGVCTRLLVK